jgi:hypothetical protein
MSGQAHQQQVARWSEHIGPAAAELRARAFFDRLRFMGVLIGGTALSVVLQLASAGAAVVGIDGAVTAVLVVGLIVRMTRRMGLAKRAAASYLGVRHWRLLPLLTLEEHEHWMSQYGATH